MRHQRTARGTQIRFNKAIARLLCSTRLLCKNSIIFQILKNGVRGTTEPHEVPEQQGRQTVLIAMETLVPAEPLLPV